MKRRCAGKKILDKLKKRVGVSGILRVGFGWFQPPPPPEVQKF
jgi:hypothetical protein